ncbi:MAG: hypothetical protein QOI20_1030, partial [Acidimicrobiaceae bacterium]|nr:hypothetical protein [Acidimicrobiaceae bacterium]
DTPSGTINLLTSVRDELTNDLLAAGTFTDTADPAVSTHRTIIGYQSGRVSSVTLPVPDAAAGALRPTRTYGYTYDAAAGRITAATVSVAGSEQPNGYSRSLSFDESGKATSHGGHATTERGPDGIATEAWWDSFNDRSYKAVDHHHQADPVGGLVTTTVYDAAGNPSASYGPGAPGEFGTPDPAKPMEITSATAPGTTTTYDGGITGLAAAWYPNAGLTATPKQHATVAPDFDWGASGPSGASCSPIPCDKFSARLSGEVKVAANATLSLEADGGRVYVDDAEVVDTWGGPYRRAVMSDDKPPRSYWRLGDPVGTSAATDTAGTSAGTYTDVILGAAGRLAADDDKAATFNGTSSRVALPADTVKGGVPMTFEAWFKTTSSGPLLGYQEGAVGPHPGAGGYVPSVYVGTDGKLHATLWPLPQLLSPQAVNNGAWHHVAMTYDGTTQALYVDGTSVGSTTGSVNWQTMGDSQLGAAFTDAWPATPGGWWHFNGTMDEVALYPSVLDAAQVAAHAAAADRDFSTATSAPLTAGTHRLRVDYQELVGPARLRLTSDAAAAFKPRYNLVTSVQDPNGQVTATDYVKADLGIGPEHSLPTATRISSAPGAEMVTTTAYERPDGTGFLRPTSKTMPAGGVTTYSYYGAGGVAATADNPCTSGVVEAINQAGALYQRVGQDPDGAGAAVPRVESFVYDEAGRVLATKVNLALWDCTTYDGRGRATQRVAPPFGAEPARTVTYNMAVGGNPAVNSVADDTAYGFGSDGAVVTTVDWLGRAIAYRDVWGNVTQTVYDQAGRVRDSSGPAGAVHTDFDAAGRGPSSQKVDGLTMASATFDSASGLQQAIAYPNTAGAGGNGTSVQIGRDVRGRLNGLTWQSGATTLASDAVTRDQGGRIVDEAYDQPSGVDGHAGNNFAYDSAGRLVDAWVPELTATPTYHHYQYAFDAVSPGCTYSRGADTNRTSMTVDSQTTTYCYDQADELVSTTDSRYPTIGYNPRGNINALGGQQFTYDGAERHMTTKSGGTELRYVRDVTDRVVARVSTVTSTVAFRAAAAGSNGAGGTSLSLARPAGTLAGDVLLAQVTAAGGTGVSTTAPAGWSLLSSQANGTAVREEIYWRVAAAGDPAAWAWSLSASQQATGSVAAYSGVDTSAAPAVASALVSGTSVSTPS